MSQPPPPPGGYGQPQYGGAPYGQPPKKSGGNKTLWIVLIVIGGLLLLCCGGVGAFFLWGVNEVDNAIEEELAGSEPETVDVGDSFEKDDIEVESGWDIVDVDGYYSITGLSITNHDDDFGAGRYIYLNFKVFKDDKALGQINCSSTTSLLEDEKADLTCSSSANFSDDFDEVRVWSDSF